MNFRTTAILFGLVLAGGLALLFVTIFTGDEPSNDALLDELVAKGVKQEQVDTVEIERTPGGKLRIEKKSAGKDGKDARWEIVEPIHARADRGAVEGVIRQLLTAKPTAYGDLTGNPAVHGLEPPTLRVTLKAGDRSATLNVGDVSIGTKSVAFVTTSNRKRPMAVPRSDIDALFRDSVSRGGGKAGDLSKWVADYRVKSVFPAEVRGITGAADVQSLKLTKGKSTVSLTQSSSGWQFEEPKGWGEAAADGDPSNPTSFTGVRPVINALTSLQAQSADDFIEHPKDLKEYGLEDGNPDRIRVELKMKDGPPVVAFIGKKADPALPKDPKLPLPPTSGKVYVKIEGEEGVIRAGGSNLDGLAAVIADPTPLRDRTLMAVDKNRVDAIDVTVGGQTVKLRKRGGQFGHWELFGAAGDPQKANEAAVHTLLDVLTEKRTIKDFPAANDANFAGPALQAEVKLWADAIEPTSTPDPKGDKKDERKEEPKLKGNPYAVQFGKKEGDSVFVRRTLPGGAKNDFTLPESVIVKTAGGPGPAGTPTKVLAAVQKSRLDFLDPELKSFSEFSANRLTITRGGQTTEVVREEKPAGSAGPPAGGWKYTQPESMKGKDADPSEVSILMTYLASQRAARFIDEQPDEKKLAEYGLDPKGPVLRVSVGLKPPAAIPGMPTPPEDGDKERVYEFGKETTDGQVYARQQGRAAVFTLPKDVFNRFANADMRDKTVVRFDRSKVKTVRLRGWFSLTGTVTTLEFERQGADWVAKTPKDFNLDPTKLNMFLGLLDGLKAKAYVPGPPQKPEYGFPPEQQGLEITLLIEGHPGIALNIGAPADNGASYYGYTNDPSAGGSAFTVNADLFKAYKEKPAAFAK